MRKSIWICIEKAEGNYAAYAPEVLGCISTGQTIEETQKNMAEALTGHLELMLEDGESLDFITGKFPAIEANAVTSDEEYFALVHIDVAAPTATTGV